MTTTPTDGRLTSLAAFTGFLPATALLMVVTPGNAAQGVNYSITFAQMALNVINGLAPTIITAAIASYAVSTTDSTVLINKTVAASTQLVLPSGASKVGSVLVKDLKGNAGTFTTTITFSGGETADGLTVVPINVDYGAWRFTPLASGGYYITAE